MPYVPIEGLRYEFQADDSEVAKRLAELGMKRVTAVWEVEVEGDDDEVDEDDDDDHLWDLRIDGDSRGTVPFRALPEVLGLISTQLAEQNPNYNEWFAFELKVTTTGLHGGLVL